MWSILIKKTKFCYFTTFVYLLLLCVHVTFLPAAMAMLSSEQNTHIVSFVAQRKTNDKYAEIRDFDFESFDENSRNENYFATNGAIEQLFGRFLSSTKKSAKLQGTDDLLNSAENTLENTNSLYTKNQHHESSQNRNDINSNAGVYQRFKQSIPVLEPIKHLLNTVGEGGFNHTTHLNKTRHHLVSPSETGAKTGDEESSAIETEAERDMAYHGTNLKVLDFLGSIGNMILGLFTNFMKWFTASSGNASAASSAGGSS